MVISPPPPKPATARMASRSSMERAAAQPRQPSMKATVATKKQARRPKRSDRRP